jgi:dTDP-4-amino-4,6-dideoxygalactose transaminase
LDENNRRRRALWALYREKLSSIEEILVPFSYSRGASSYHIFPVLLSEQIVRDDFMEYLSKKGIQTSIHYPPVHLFSYYKNLMPSYTELPVTEYVGRREVTLPLFPAMKEHQIDCVVNAIKGFLDQTRKRQKLSLS